MIALRGAARFGVLVAAVLVAGHDSLYLAAYGLRDYRHALASSGHGVPWTGICLAALLTVGAVAVVAIQRSHRLNRRLRQLGAPPVQTVPAGQLASRIAGLWLPLLVIALTLFAVQENVEHFTNHKGHLPLLEVLYAGEYQWAIPIFALVALAVAVVGTVATAHLRALTDAIERWLDGFAPRAGLRFTLSARRGFRQTHIGQPYRGRAPPRTGMTLISS
jgi:hypothetical protein